jgi:hypothetical protein
LKAVGFRFKEIMTSLLRFAAVAALISLVTGTGLEDVIPTRTAGPSGGYGTPFSEPTKGPSLELVKMRFEKRSVTNLCTEWTIPGGFGQPVCSNSETCLFTTAPNGYYYEGCGQTSIRYDWITACYSYPQSKAGTVPASQIWCDATAPYCGYFAFVFGVGYTFYNYGCSTVPYTLFVDLVATTSANLIGNSGQTVTVTAAPTYISQSQSTDSLTQTTTSAPASSSTNPIITQHDSPKKTPIGAIVGGVIGGVALIAFLIFLFWLYKHKKSQAKPDVMQQQQQALDTSAYNNPNRISEIGGVMLNKPPQAPFSQPPNSQSTGNYFPEKPVVGGNTQELYRPDQQQQHQTAYIESSTTPASGIPSPGSPPPTYTQPNSPNPGHLQPQPPVPLPTAQNAFISPQQGYNELEDQHQQQPSQRNSYVPYSPPAAPATHNELPAQTGVEAGQRTSYVPPAAGNVQEMSGSAATGGIARRPVQRQGQGGFDMSGGPMSEEFHGHELP